MNAMAVADKLRELWDANGGLIGTLLDVKSNVERNAEVGMKDKSMLLDVKMGLEELAFELGKILSEVQNENKGRAVDRAS